MLISVLEFILLRYCTISFLCEIFRLQITAKESKILESVLHENVFILNLTSETAVNFFEKICLVLEIKGVASLIKIQFYQNEAV